MPKSTNPFLLASQYQKRKAGGRALRRAGEAMARKDSPTVDDLRSAGVQMSIPTMKAIIRRNKARKGRDHE